jgi:Flp pilus assembly protein TadG
MAPKSAKKSIRSERGAALIHVGIAMFVLVAMSAFVLDFGVMWMARRQAQNAADAGALAGAIARGFDETTDPPASNGLAYNSALTAAQANTVFNQAGGVVVTWTCPSYVPTTSRCVRVDVHRDGTAGSNALPVFFANMFGVTTQPVQATATAWVGGGTTTECLRPFAVVDKWNDIVNPTLTPAEFERWVTSGPTKGSELATHDIYTPPDSSSAGTGYRVTPAPGDVGAQVFLKTGNNPQSAAGSVVPGWSLPVRLPDGDGGYLTGAQSFSEGIKHCTGNPVSIGDYLPAENGVMQGPTRSGVQQDVDSLVNQDPNATWDTAQKAVTGSCAPGCAEFSPRIVPIGVLDIDEFQWRSSTNNWTTPWVPGTGPGSGSTFSCPGGATTGCIRIVNIIGFFVEAMESGSGDVRGRLVRYPGTFTTGSTTVAAPAAFLNVIQLIR